MPEVSHVEEVAETVEKLPGWEGSMYQVDNIQVGGLFPETADQTIK